MLIVRLVCENRREISNRLAFSCVDGYFRPHFYNLFSIMTSQYDLTLAKLPHDIVRRPIKLNTGETMRNLHLVS